MTILKIGLLFELKEEFGIYRIEVRDAYTKKKIDVAYSDSSFKEAMIEVLQKFIDEAVFKKLEECEIK